MEPKCEFLGQTRSKFDLWPQLYGSFLWIFKQSYFSLLINARKQILAIFGPNRNHMTVYMEPKCEFLGQIRSRYDLWPQLLRSILHIFQKCFLLLLIKDNEQLFGNFGPKSGLSNCIYGAKCEFLGQIRSRFDLWPQLCRSILPIFKKIIFLLITNARKQL